MAQALLFPDPRPLVERLGRDFFRGLPMSPGVYLMRDAQGQIVYVGKAKNLQQRLKSYRVANPDRLSRRHLRLLRTVMRIEWEACADEAGALDREAALLLELKPRFNRAGTWPARPRFLTWRQEGVRLALAVAGEPAVGWARYGPFGGGIAHFRAALARLLWLVLNPATGVRTLPPGWLQGRLGAIAWVTAAAATAGESPQSGRDLEPAAGRMLTALVSGDALALGALVAEHTRALAPAYEVALRDADLETVVQFMAAHARRPQRFLGVDPAPDPAASEPGLPFAPGGGAAA